MVLGERAVAGGGHLDGDLQVLGELAQLVHGPGGDDPAPGHDHRTAGVEQELDGQVDGLRARRGRLDGQRRVERGVVAAHPALHRAGEGDQHRAGAAGPGGAERLAEHPRRLGRGVEPHGPLRHGAGDGHRVGPFRPGRDADQRHGVGERGVQGRDQAGAGRADRDADLAAGPRPPVRGEPAALLLGQGDPAQAGGLHGGRERKGGGAGAGEDRVHALRPQHRRHRVHTGDRRCGPHPVLTRSRPVPRCSPRP
ncbi:hypothetical protein BJF78_20465 [Pseudonocardia sp. CNS-139]|nr:hypothetical protein BJF78_20465 [Pseudonocardia sp. CNS-139]